MTNEKLIADLCERAEKLWLENPVNSVTCIAVAVYLGEINQAWFVYYDHHTPQNMPFSNYIGEGKDLNTALLDLESYVIIEEEKQIIKLEKKNTEYLSEHRELILAGIGFGD